MVYKLFVLIVWICISKLVVSERCLFYYADVYELGYTKHYTERVPCECSRSTLDCSSRNRTTFVQLNRCSEKISVANISYNRITELPRTAFANMPKLALLFLNNNYLQHLPIGIFCFLPELQMINLDWNQLKYLPQYIFYGLRKLKNISLKNNKLRIISSNIFSTLPALEKLVLENNLLQRISPSAFTSSKELHVINLRNNTLATLPVGLFQEETTIDIWDLSENRLRIFSSCHVAGLSTISVLNLSGNKLTSLPILGKNPKIRTAIFSGNDIQTVNEHELRPWLEDENSPRFMTLKDSLFRRTTLLRNLTSLIWILEDSNLKVDTSDESCKCGTVRNGRAMFEFCVKIECGPKQKFVDWKDAVRYAKCNDVLTNDSYKCRLPSEADLNRNKII